MFFFLNDTATTEIYTLSLHDALPIFPGKVFKGKVTEIGSQAVLRTSGLATTQSTASNQEAKDFKVVVTITNPPENVRPGLDRKSTRLNSSHSQISYAVFCLKKKISCLIWMDLVASLPLIKERILVIILLLHFLSLMLGSVLVLMLPLLVWLTPDLRIKKSLLKCNWTIRKRLPRCKMRLKKRFLAFSLRLFFFK